jgi:outer membrane protein assembly factor BamB
MVASRSSGSGRIAASPQALIAVLLALLGVAVGHGEESWPQFRGPSGQGRTDEPSLPLHWSESEGVRWKTPLPGRGWSSPVAANGRIWVTTAEEREPTPEEQERIQAALSSNSNPKQMSAAGAVTLSALEVDLASGSVVRQLTLFQVDSPAPIHGLNSYASPTPAIAKDRLVCHFGAMGTACVDTTTGEVLWRKQLAIDHIVGPGSSPVIYQGLVILTCDGGDKQFITALDIETGEPAWQRNRPPIRIENPDMRKAYCTPLVITVDGRDQAVIPGAQWFIAYDPLNGQEIWRVDHGGGFSNVPAPIFDGERVYLDTGFGRAQLWAVQVAGVQANSEPPIAWRHTQQMPTMPSPVVSSGRIYAISDGGVASCLDAATGKVLWRERVPGQYSASPILGAGRVYFSNHDGRTTVLADRDEFEVLAENELDGKHMASPAVIEGDLIMRTDSHLYRIQGVGEGS